MEVVRRQSSTVKQIQLPSEELPSSIGPVDALLQYLEADSGTEIKCPNLSQSYIGEAQYYSQKL